MSVSWVREEASLPRGPENAPLFVRRVITIGGMISMGLFYRQHESKRRRRTVGEREGGKEERRNANGHVGEDSTSGTLHDSHLPSFRTLPQILLLFIPINRVMRDLEHFHTVAHLFPSDTRDIDDTGAGDGCKGHELGEEVFGGGGDAEAGDEAGERDGKEDGGECGGDIR